MKKTNLPNTHFLAAVLSSSALFGALVGCAATPANSDDGQSEANVIIANESKDDKEEDEKKDPGSNSVELPANWYPESLNAGSDGTIYVGSFATGRIAKFKPGDRSAQILVGASETIKNMAGVLVDDATSTILACTFDISKGVGGGPSVIHRFSTIDGSHKASYPFQANGVCNDMTFDREHNVFIADSMGHIYKLVKNAEDGSSPTLWLSDPILAPIPPAIIGADGIAFDGKDSLFVNTISENRLLRIKINSDGKPGEIDNITVTPPLNAPDGMRALNDKTLIVAEAPASRVSKIEITGKNTARLTVLDDTLDEPASVVKVGDDLWVSEGQIGRFVSNTPPHEPFKVKRIPND